MSGVVYGRYLYQPQGQAWWLSLSFGYPPRNTRTGHDGLVAEWNRKDRGIRVWKWQEVFSTDIDHPANVEAFEAIFELQKGG